MCYKLESSLYLHISGTCLVLYISQSFYSREEQPHLMNPFSTGNDSTNLSLMKPLELKPRQDVKKTIEVKTRQWVPSQETKRNGSEQAHQFRSPESFHASPRREPHAPDFQRRNFGTSRAAVDFERGPPRSADAGERARTSTSFGSPPLRQSVESRLRIGDPPRRAEIGR